MKMRLYQINLDRDEDRVAFSSLDELERLQGTKEVNPELYDMVFDGNVGVSDLEEAFEMFNVCRPEYCGRSMSVSDVVEVFVTRFRKISEAEYEEYEESRFFYCDDCGFIEIDFSNK